MGFSSYHPQDDAVWDQDGFVWDQDDFIAVHQNNWVCDRMMGRFRKIYPMLRFPQDDRQLSHLSEVDDYAICVCVFAVLVNWAKNGGDKTRKLSTKIVAILHRVLVRIQPRRRHFAKPMLLNEKRIKRESQSTNAFFPQTVFDCRGSNGLGLKRGQGGGHRVPALTFYYKKPQFVTPTFENPK